MALVLHLEEPAVDVVAQRDELGQVRQLAADPEVEVADLQAGVDLLAEDPGSGRWLAAATQDAAAEDELHALGSAKVEVVFDHLLKELTAVERAVEDLGATDLKLTQGQW